MDEESQETNGISDVRRKMKIKIIHVGQDGPTLRVGQTVSVNYHLYLDDSLRDSTHLRRTPFSFRYGVGEVIPAWDAIVSEMSVGERCTATVNPEFAYGEKGFPGFIPPNTEFSLDVELLSVL